MSDLPAPREDALHELFESERNRIGNELHDGVGQYITGIRMLSEHLEHVIAEDCSDQKQRLVTQIAEFARAATMQLQYIQHNLTPPELADLSLGEALDDLCGLVDAIPDTTCRFETEVDLPEVDAERRHHLYRIAQEALHNAMRHGNAATITLRLGSDPGDQLVLEVQDDGRGFDQRSTTQSGLHKMHQRADEIGARLEVRSNPGDGTAVRCRLRETASPHVPE